MSGHKKTSACLTMPHMLQDIDDALYKTVSRALTSLDILRTGRQYPSMRAYQHPINHIGYMCLRMSNDTHRRIISRHDKSTGQIGSRV